MFVRACVGFIICFSFAFVNSAIIKNDLYQLDIVHFNDYHDRFEETSVNFTICKTNDTQCIGGFARLYYEINKLLKEMQNPLFLNAGDVFQDTYWFTLLTWRIEQEFMNKFNVDATALGNHEFDVGPEELSKYIKGLKSPVIAANVDASNDPYLNGLFEPRIVVEKKGRRIGIIGLITTDTARTSNPGDNIKFLDPIETVKREAQQLVNEGVNIIIVLSHCGLSVDKDIAKEAGENIDIIVGGHSHDLLWNGTSPSNESVAGPYPLVLTSKSKPDHDVVIVTASAFSKYLGNITTYFDKKGDLLFFDASPVFLNRSIPEDPKIKAELKPYEEYLHKKVKEVVGTTSQAMLNIPCSSNECTLGDLVADAFKAKAMKMNSTLPHLAFIERNVMRGSIEKGAITRGTIMTMMPFSNKIWTVELQGKYVLQVLQMSLTRNYTLKPFSGPWMPSVAGMKVTVNTTDSTVRMVLVNEDGQYVPLDEEKYYQFTTIHFFIRGGNDLTMLKEHSRNIKELGVDYEVMIDYIKQITPITPKLDNRLTVLS